MAELKFVIKVFFMTAIVVFLMQFKIGNESLEQKTHYLVTESSTAQDIRKGIRYSLRFLGEKFNIVGEKARQSAEETKSSVGGHISSFGKKASKALKELPAADIAEAEDELGSSFRQAAPVEEIEEYAKDFEEGVY